MQPKFEVIEDDSKPEELPLSINTVIEGLKALPKKTANAVAACFALTTVATVFWLMILIIGNPNALQLIGLAGYSLFVLTINWIVKRRQ